MSFCVGSFCAVSGFGRFIETTTKSPFCAVENGKALFATWCREPFWSATDLQTDRKATDSLVRRKIHENLLGLGQHILDSVNERDPI